MMGLMLIGQFSFVNYFELKVIITEVNSI